MTLIWRPGLQDHLFGDHGLEIHVGLMTIKMEFLWHVDDGGEINNTGSPAVPEFTSRLKLHVDIQSLLVEKCNLKYLHVSITTKLFEVIWLFS